jgi:AcrR family transcriptional regulator
MRNLRPKPPARVSVDLPLQLRAVPVQARSKQSVERILDTAAHLLDEVGLEGFNTNLLAQRANVKVRTVYRYFPDKYALLLALMQRLSAEWQASEEAEAMAAPDWETALRAAIIRWVKGIAARPGAVSVIKALGVIPALREYDRHILDRMIMTMMTTLKARGVQLPDATLREVCRVSMSALNSGIELYYGLGPREQKVYLEQLTVMLIAYLRLYLK